MTENTQHWGPFGPPSQPPHINLEPWRIQPSPSGRTLLWIVPGYTHVIGSVN